MSFKDRYGPWAVIAGTSEGTGRAFARRVAAEGINCILIARREGPLDELARQIRSEKGVECIAAAIDLARHDDRGDEQIRIRRKAKRFLRKSVPSHFVGLRNGNERKERSGTTIAGDSTPAPSRIGVCGRRR